MHTLVYLWMAENDRGRQKKVWFPKQIENTPSASIGEGVHTGANKAARRGRLIMNANAGHPDSDEIERKRT